jgi:hypothetical protein
MGFKVQNSFLTYMMAESLNVPKLDSSYSGIPERLHNEAVMAKEKTQSLKTLPHSKARSSPIRLPPDTDQDQFDIAIAALKKILRETGVEVNDKPLVDGWYMVSCSNCRKTYG